jgi:hypothetical protein
MCALSHMALLSLSTGAFQGSAPAGGGCHRCNCSCLRRDVAAGTGGSGAGAGTDGRLQPAKPIVGPGRAICRLVRLRGGCEGTQSADCAFVCSSCRPVTHNQRAIYGGMAACMGKSCCFELTTVSATATIARVSHAMQPQMKRMRLRELDAEYQRELKGITLPGNR